MIPLLIMLMVVALLSTIMMGDITRYMEAQVAAVDAAQVAAGPQGEAVITVPQNMRAIDRIFGSSSCDLTALGSAVLGCELTGNGLLHSPQRFILAAGGAELVDGSHNGSRAIEYGPMGIGVVPNNPITVNYWQLGEAVGIINVGETFVFSAAPRMVNYQWQSLEVQPVDDDVNIQFQGWGTAAAALMPVPAQTTNLPYMMTALGGDQAVLGGSTCVALGTGNGLVNTQEVALGGNAGELTVGAGFWANAGFLKTNFEVRKADSISWFARMTGEDSGTQSAAIACAFPM